MKKRVVILSNGKGELADHLVTVLLEAGFIPYVQASQGFLDSLPSIDPDVVVVDLGGRRNAEDDMALVYRVRRDMGLRVIALVDALSSHGADAALEADDFVLMPLRDEELVARIGRLARASGERSDAGLSLGDLLIDTDGCQVLLDGEVVDLTFKEYELLKFLAQNPGKVFTREVLLNQVWGYDYYGGERTVDVHIRRLRSKLEVGGRTFIETVRGVGYMLRRMPGISVMG